MTLALKLYSRRGCGLCDDMLDALEQQCRGHDVSLHVVDIDLDHDLRQRYGQDVPVLVTADGAEICRHRLDSARVADILRS